MYVIVDAQIALSLAIADGEAGADACGTAAARTAASESSENGAHHGDVSPEKGSTKYAAAFMRTPPQ